MKNWITKQWMRFKRWVVSVLVALGLITGTVMAASVTFTYTPATEYVDGTPMPLSDIDFTRLYCDGSMVAEEAGADGGFFVVLGFGTHNCHATHVVIGASVEESAPSNVVVKVVAVPQPGSPTTLESD